MIIVSKEDEEGKLILVSRQLYKWIAWVNCTTENSCLTIFPSVVILLDWRKGGIRQRGWPRSLSLLRYIWKLFIPCNETVNLLNRLLSFMIKNKTKVIITLVTLKTCLH